MNRQCDLIEFEDLANEYIALFESYAVNKDFLGNQMMTLNAANALLKQEIKRLEKKLEFKRKR